jgi:hypothetical protein
MPPLIHSEQAVIVIHSMRKPPFTLRDCAIFGAYCSS